MDSSQPLAGQDSSTDLTDDSLLAGHPRLTLSSSVLAIVPHFQCEAWLSDCLESLVGQTRRPDAIVVVDDASETPPFEIVARFPQVTLLVAAENVGPYALIQAVIDSTDYDAYLFQDADDWSLPPRLELLLREAEQSGADMVGCQGHRLISIEGEVVPLTFPLDVNAALSVNPVRHVVMHPSSLVSRDLIVRAGGYATGMRFAGDTEFEHRATHVGRIVNLPDYAYVVRNRSNSLTSSPETGLSSPEREALREIERARARENAELVAAGEPPNLEPIALRDPVPLTHMAGPQLRAVDGARSPWSAMAVPTVTTAADIPSIQARDDTCTRVPRPIFVIGSLRSGASLLTLCLGQHPRIRQTLETGWFERFALGLQQAYGVGISPRETSQLDATGVELGEFFAHFGEAIDRLMMLPRTTADLAATRWLDGSQSNARNIRVLLRLFPQAQVIHVVREASDVVSTLTNRQNNLRHYKSRRTPMSEQAASDHWLEAVSAGVEAERAFGSATILRVRRRTLVERPEETLRTILAFLGEPFEPACLRPFRSASGDCDPAGGNDLSGIPADLDPSDPPHIVTIARSRSLMSWLLNQDGQSNYPRDEAEIAQLDIAFMQQCAREVRLLAGPKAKSAGSGIKPISPATPNPATRANRQNGKLHLRMPDLGRSVRAVFGRRTT